MRSGFGLDAYYDIKNTFVQVLGHERDEAPMRRCRSVGSLTSPDVKQSLEGNPEHCSQDVFTPTSFAKQDGGKKEEDEERLYGISLDNVQAGSTSNHPTATTCAAIERDVGEAAYGAQQGATRHARVGRLHVKPRQRPPKSVRESCKAALASRQPAGACDGDTGDLEELSKRNSRYIFNLLQGAG